MKQATKVQIDAFHCHEMHNSPVCWTSPKMIDDELKKVKIKHCQNKIIENKHQDSGECIWLK